MFPRMVHMRVVAVGGLQYDSLDLWFRQLADVERHHQLVPLLAYNNRGAPGVKFGLHPVFNGTLFKIYRAQDIFRWNAA